VIDEHFSKLALFGAAAGLHCVVQQARTVWCSRLALCVAAPGFPVWCSSRLALGGAAAGLHCVVLQQACTVCYCKLVLLKCTTVVQAKVLERLKVLERRIIDYGFGANP